MCRTGALKAERRFGVDTEACGGLEPDLHPGAGVTSALSVPPSWGPAPAQAGAALQHPDRSWGGFCGPPGRRWPSVGAEAPLISIAAHPFVDVVRDGAEDHVSESARAAVTKYCRLSSSNDRLHFSQFWGLESKTKVPAERVPGEIALPGLQMATFLLSSCGLASTHGHGESKPLVSPSEATSPTG